MGGTEIWCAHHGRKTRCAAASSCAFHAVIRGWLMNGCNEEDPQSSPPQSWSCEHTSPGISQYGWIKSCLTFVQSHNRSMQVPGRPPATGPLANPGVRAVGGVVATFAGAFGGLAAVTAIATGVSRKVVVSRLRASGAVCYLCQGRKFVTCRTCGGDKAIEWQPLANPGVRRLCACPTCGGKTGLQKCNNCVGLGYA